MSNRPLNIVRVISGYSGEPDRFYDLTEVPYKEGSELRAYWSKHSYHVQNVFLEDLMTVRVGLELQKRDEEARKKVD